jgi:hypothetical protein
VLEQQRFRQVPLASAASGVLFVSAKSTQKPLRLRRWIRQRPVASSPLAACRSRTGANSGIPAVEHARLSRAIGTANGAVCHSVTGHPWPATLHFAKSQVMDDRQ